MDGRCRKSFVSRCLGDRTVLKAVQIKEKVVLKTSTCWNLPQRVRTAQNRVIIFVVWLTRRVSDVMQS